MGTRVCGIEGCGKTHLARGMCENHYRQWWRKQDLHYREYQRKWGLANPEKVREYQRKWGLAHRERKRDYLRKWELENPKKRRCIEAKKRAHKSNTLDNLTIEDVTAILARGCFFANLGDCDGPLSLAHNVAVSQGGNTTEANVFCLCRRHNSRMGTKNLSEMFSQLALV